MPNCSDYLSVAQAKALGIGVGLTDAALAGLLMGLSDFVDETVGTPFSRALRVYYPDTSDGTTACTVAVTATSLDFVITGGPNAGASSFAFANWTTIQDLVSAVNGAGYGIVIDIMHSPWIASQPSGNLALRSAVGIFGIENWAVLCLARLSVCLSGNGDPFLFLPFEPQSVSAVSEDGTALTAGTHYFTHREGWLERAAYGCVASSMVSCGSFVCDCPTPGCWSCQSPCNVTVTFVPRHSLMSMQAKGAMALAELLKVNVASSGFQSETVGRYSYQLGSGSGAGGVLGLFWQLIAPMQNDNGVVAGIYPGFHKVL